MRTPIFTKKFQKELKKCKSRGLNTSEIGDIMAKLIEDKPLDTRNKNHPLSQCKLISHQSLCDFRV